MRAEGSKHGDPLRRIGSAQGTGQETALSIPTAPVLPSSLWCSGFDSGQAQGSGNIGHGLDDEGNMFVKVDA